MTAGPQARRMLFVYTRPTEGMEEEYDRWYSDEHLDDILTLDGFDAAQRWVFDLPHPADGPAPEWRNVALYEVPGDSYDRARAALVASGEQRAKALAEGTAPQVRLSPALDDDRLAYWFVENSPRRTRDGSP